MKVPEKRDGSGVEEMLHFSQFFYAVNLTERATKPTQPLDSQAISESYQKYKKVTKW